MIASTRARHAAGLCDLLLAKIQEYACRRLVRVSRQETSSQFNALEPYWVVYTHIGNRQGRKDPANRRIHAPCEARTQRELHQGLPVCSRCLVRTGGF